MPYWHCTECHHEWEGTKNNSQCDWCKAEGYITENETPLEKTIKNIDKIVKHMVEKKDKQE